jgi:hypothetical protein
MKNEVRFSPAGTVYDMIYETAAYFEASSSIDFIHTEILKKIISVNNRFE